MITTSSKKFVTISLFGVLTWVLAFAQVNGSYRLNDSGTPAYCEKHESGHPTSDFPFEIPSYEMEFDEENESDEEFHRHCIKIALFKGGCFELNSISSQINLSIHYFITNRYVRGPPAYLV